MPSKGVLPEHIRTSGGVQRPPERSSNWKATTTHLLLGPTSGYSYHHSYAENPTALYYSIKEPELLAHYDKLYQLLHYIPHRETFLLNYTAVILAQEKFEAALKGAQTSLPIQHQYYLAVIVHTLSVRPPPLMDVNTFGRAQLVLFCESEEI